MTFYVYSLSCPKSGDAKYIGQTKDAEKRLLLHMVDAKATNPTLHAHFPKDNWIKELSAEGLKPLINILDSAETKKEIDGLEIKYIQEYSQKGEIFNRSFNPNYKKDKPTINSVQVVNGGIAELRLTVREVMAQNRISLRQLSQETKISPKTIMRFLKGEGRQFDMTIVSICRHLGIDWRNSQ